ncbi:type II toxin-antitoxin system RatA family toxin [Sporohalobacter salinus]|uniref:type II toxin-antitoxin system RatA family toxin n=1 Tax=Sporohalobacter salinus TaxID=1494606 RepID=UPI001961B384|nr:aromatase/cyclase [Sporohalobacter salinus]MBM7623397.1 ribosome-associated toxin RatA of RatAB toxin-antitoxin module [Sporohalobacter salinus]
MPDIENSILIDGEMEEVYEVAKDMENYPQFMENIVEVKVVERGENTTITSWIAEVDDKRLTWKEKDIFDPENKHISYKLIEGDLKKFSGEWQFEEKNMGTKLRLTVNFEFGVPMLSAVVNPILKKKVISNSKAMLKAIKEEVEA